MMITMDAVDLTQDEINFIKTRKPTKQLAFALLFKCYQESHKFLDDLTNIPGHITNKLAHLLNVPPIISKISLRTYGNYISLIKEQYSQIVKYTAAMKAGHADPESILRRFNQNNLKHPTYMALSQLGKVLKTIFICNYLMHESTRQEIQEGLNVVELWNGVSKFIFYGRAGEISSNHEKAQTLSVMSLHLLQLSMVYINTLMIQQIIEEHGLKDILTKEDKRALTPLIYEHVNPYGFFPLDLSTRLPHLHYKVAA